VSDSLQLQQRDHLAIITLNRPASLNAMTREMVSEMHDMLDALEEEFPKTRVVVLTGTGRGFCTGTDMKALTAAVAQRQASPARPDRPRERNIGDLSARLFALPQPVVAAVNGVAVGAGFAMMLASDIRVAASSARFGGIFIDRSLPPDGGSSYTLASIVGPAVAAELLYTGRIYDSEWALRAGLVSTVVEDGELMPAALALADEMAAKPPLALQHTKALLHHFAPKLADVIDREMAVNDLLGATEDKVEAIAAYTERRPPVFQGR
jgi:enoyl-CoA hydratase/carnithine racemase